ncbi:MAG: hypothetical protein HY331_19195 [Chloroflexi bacterium]|nr:hypothetical protein [Chloroflexota bacterium]
MGGSFVKLTLLWLLLNLMDTVSTLVAFQHGLVELNPLPSWILGEFGLAQFIAWKWFWVGWIPLVIWALRNRFRLLLVLRCGVGILNFVVVWNVYWVGRAIAAV